ncbi:hypothetical protein TD95_000433 [Thielaviopsis punctulata]|uniref:EF-hand n=1 Tax=Thielaviopsis punctulata TaxID=72032 RepID=A0A0F4ZGW6_9PEZI|nr:hypothetical protein TD95_000433 [Thielaviopsis punctulata]
MMWYNMPWNSAFSRPRFAFVAVISAISFASISYYVYQLRNTLPTPPPGSGLRRHNALRRPRRRARISDDNEYAIPEGNEDENNENNNETDEWGEDNEDDETYMPNPTRAGYNIVGLLFRVSEDNSRRNAYVHRGCQCNYCSVVPIRGIRYRCINCADFDLCESCEGQGLHNKNHVFLKIKVPVPPAGLRTIQPVLYTGDPDSCVRHLPRPFITRLCRETGFERTSLESYWERWTYMANTEWREDPDDLCLVMDRKTFDRCIVHTGNSKSFPPNLVHDRMFAFFDTNGDGLISFREYLHGLAYRNQKDRLRRVFDGYDIDGDGYVDRKDFLRMFRAYFTIFRQIHKDILDGLESQVLSLVETQQMVSGRTPLSSYFGSDENIPQANIDETRTQGKMLRPDGSTALPSLAPHMVLPSNSGQATRAEVLSAVFSIKTAQESSRTGSLPRLTHTTSLLDPPTDLRELLNLVTRVSGDGTASRFGSGADDGQNSRLREHIYSSDEVGSEAVQSNGNYTRDASSSRDSVPGETSTEAAPASQPRQMHELSEGERELQQKVRRQMFERWQRRQFYLDVEEGAQCPHDWNDDHDIVDIINDMAHPPDSNGNANGNGFSANTRSRSSSKVRFVDEGDDFDTRSNASTSSRSIPERWGGFDIPEAERDVGKEILYLTAQEAFNELLDVFFKAKEDLAVKVAETREERQQYMSLITDMSSRSEYKLKKANRPKSRDSSGQRNSSGTASREAPTPSIEGAASRSSSNPPVSIPHVRFDGHENESSAESDLASREPTEDKTEAYRDPTMPQFRPNSEPAIVTTTITTDSENRVFSISRSDSAAGSTADSAYGSTSSKKTSTVGRSGQISEGHLRKLRKYHEAELEAAKRHGFGKLNYEEFKKIYREQEEAHQRMDFLETWIDICMP